MFKVDLHTHSEASPDGGISLAQYRAALHTNLLDVIAITDHNRVAFAQEAQKEFGDQIIVGEEIMTNQGEIIGLYLTELVVPNQSPEDTIKAIKDQGGLVYLPHPFETVRKGLHPQLVEQLSDDIDIIEVCNGRAFLQNRGEQALVWSRLNNVPGAAASDAHGSRGLGVTYSSMEKQPTQETLVKLLSTAKLITDRPSLRALLYPKYHRTRKKLQGRR